MKIIVRRVSGGFRACACLKTWKGWCHKVGRSKAEAIGYLIEGYTTFLEIEEIAWDMNHPGTKNFLSNNPTGLLTSKFDLHLDKLPKVSKERAYLLTTQELEIPSRLKKLIRLTLGTFGHAMNDGIGKLANKSQREIRSRIRSPWTGQKTMAQLIALCGHYGIPLQP